MALNFPSGALTVGQLYPQPPVNGVPVYRWDGVAWTTQGATTPFPVLSDGSVPMTAQLKLITPPVAATDAASKAYADGEIRWDVAQSLTLAQQVQAQANANITTLQTMAYNGMQVNGAFDINQSGTLDTNVSGVSGYIADCWYLLNGGPTLLNANWASSSSGALPTNFTNCMQISVTGADVSPASADYVALAQWIEGYRVAKLGWGTTSAQPLSFSFWIRTSRAGMYSGAIENNSQNRSYPFTFTMNAAGTWEYKTVTVPGDTAGTWLTTNGIGLRIFITMMCGTYYSGAPNVWTSNYYVAATGTTNGVASTSDYMWVTGLLALVGSELPRAEVSYAAQRPADQEILLCRRYFYNRPPTANGVTVSNACYRVGCRHQVIMRAAPTVALVAGQTVSMTDGSNVANISSMGGAHTTETFEIDSVALTGGTLGSGRSCCISTHTANLMTVDARL